MQEKCLKLNCLKPFKLNLEPGSLNEDGPVQWYFERLGPDMTDHLRFILQCSFCNKTDENTAVF